MIRGLVATIVVALTPGAAAVAAAHPPVFELTFLGGSHHTSFDLYTVRSDGTGLRKVLRHIDDGAWSPNGKRFAYYCPRVGGFCVADPPTRSGRLVFDASCPSGADEAWSPIRSIVAFACTGNGPRLGDLRWRTRLVIVRLDVSPRARVIFSALERGFPQVGGLAWSPDGSRLAFYKTMVEKKSALRAALRQSAQTAAACGRLRECADSQASITGRRGRAMVPNLHFRHPLHEVTLRARSTSSR